MTTDCPTWNARLPLTSTIRNSADWPILPFHSWYQTDTMNFVGQHANGEIWSWGNGSGLVTDLSPLQRVHWHCFVLLVHNQPLTFQPITSPGTLRKSSTFCPLNLLKIVYSNQTIRSLVTDGNFVADHIKQKDDQHDEWLSDGEGIMTTREPYGTHLKTAKPTTDVCFSMACSITNSANWLFRNIPVNRWSTAFGLFWMPTLDQESRTS